jgi:hypothetical protein
MIWFWSFRTGTIFRTGTGVLLPEWHKKLKELNVLPLGEGRGDRQRAGKREGEQAGEKVCDTPHGAHGGASAVRSTCLVYRMDGAGLLANDSLYSLALDFLSQSNFSDFSDFTRFVRSAGFSPSENRSNI